MTQTFFYWARECLPENFSFFSSTLMQELMMNRDLSVCLFVEPILVKVEEHQLIGQTPPNEKSSLDDLSFSYDFSKLISEGDVDIFRTVTFK